MDLSQIIVCGVVLLVFISFVKEWFSPEITAFAGLLSLVLMEVIDVESALSVFSNPAPITVACMFVLSAALERTGMIEALGRWFARVGGTTETRVMVSLFLVAAVLSAFVNNTPVVVVFMPIVISLARRRDLMPSRLLIPLSYASILGGTCTLIGTSTNLIVYEIARDAGMEAMGIFEMGRLGIFFVAVGFVYLLTFGRKLLPARPTLSSLIDNELSKEFLTYAVISENSPLVGDLYVETPLAKVRGVRILEVRRHGVRVQTPLPKLRLGEGDQLLFKGDLSAVIGVRQTEGLELSSDLLGLEKVQTESAVLMEGIIGPHSTMVGHSLKELNFRQRYGVIVLAVHRQGVNLQERFEEVKLAFGDTLLLEGPAERIQRLFEEKDFINLTQPKHRPLRRSKAPFPLIALGLFMVLGSFNVLPLVVLALLGVLLTLVTRTLDSTEAYQSVEWRVIFLILGMLGIGKAMQDTGMVTLLAQQIIGLFGALGPWVIISVLYFLTALFTEMISNNAVAALLTPIALGLAAELGVAPQPFVIAVMFGASASFSTPIGYQTNTYVYGAGGYRFSDFPRVGVPLALILWVVATILIPILWPL